MSTTHTDIIQPASLPCDSVQPSDDVYVRPDRTMPVEEALKVVFSSFSEIEQSVQATKRDLVIQYLIPNVRDEADAETAKAAISREYDSPVRRAEFGAVIRAIVKNPEEVVSQSGSGWNALVDACRKIAPASGKAKVSTEAKSLSSKAFTKLLEEVEEKATPAQVALLAEEAVAKVEGDAAIEKIVSAAAKHLDDAETAIKLAALILEVASGLTEQEAPMEAIMGAKGFLDEFLDIRQTLSLEAGQAESRNDSIVFQGV